MSNIKKSLIKERKFRQTRIRKKPLVFVIIAALFMWSGVFAEEVSVTIGSVTISTYSPVDITKLEQSTNLYFKAKNNGSQKVTLESDGAPWMPGMIFWTHFFWFFDIDGVELDSGEETTLEFIMANSGAGDANLDFGFSITETSEEGKLSVRVRSDVSPGFQELSTSATVAGKITTGSGLSAASLANAEVKLYLYNGTGWISGKTDSQGNYSISCPAIEDIENAFGSRTLPYSTLGYFLLVEEEGYSLGYKGGIEPKRGETTTVDITLTSVDTYSYKKIGELTTSTPHGYWWLMPNSDFSKLAGVQGRHPPALEVAGHIIMTDLNGQELWNVATDDECWGFDFSADGQIAAGSHIGTIYMLDTSGNILWKKGAGGMVRDVEFSPDGSYLFTGPSDNNEIALLDSSTGTAVWTRSRAGTAQWLRNSRFSPDGKRIIAGYSGGRMEMLTDAGELLWTAYIGEFPMVLEIDDQYNIYAAGKNRELFSYDASGNLRWRERIPNHVVTAGSDNMPDDGSLVVLGTVGGFAIAINNSGEVVWQRQLQGSLQGHNALDITPDGEWIVIGSAGEEGVSGTVALFDKNGTMLWSHTSTDRRDTGEISFSYDYDHNHRGAITVAISDDAKYIAAGYGDSTIRIFERSTAPSDLTSTAASSGCFIATACFGSVMAEEVQILCAFRDKFLMRDTVGRAFVRFYDKHSPKVTGFIRKREGLKAVMRTGLEPLVWAAHQIVKK